MNTTTVNAETTNQAPPSDQDLGSEQEPASSGDLQQLYRPTEDRMVAGVASGIARYLRVDVNVVRIVLVVLAVIGGAGVPLYVAGWLLIPEEGSEQSIAAGFINSRRNSGRDSGPASSG
jgi:phage shock protein C